MVSRGLFPEAIVVGDVQHISILVLLWVVTATKHKITYFFFLKFETRSHVAHAFKLTM